MNNSQRRRVENEVIFRERNDAIKEMAKELLANDNKTDMRLQFVCECADENCRETIELSISEYEAARGNDQEFIIKPGHEQSDVEKVVKRDGHFVVEKFFTPPPTDGHLNQT